MTNKEKFIASGGTVFHNKKAEDLTEEEASEALWFIWYYARILYIG